MVSNGGIKKTFVLLELLIELSHLYLLVQLLQVLTQTLAKNVKACRHPSTFQTYDRLRLNQAEKE